MFIEAGALGVPIVASAADAFERAISEGQSGFLAATRDDWLNKLRALVEEPGLRQEIAANARRAVIDHYSPQARTADLAALLPQLRSVSRNRTAALSADQMR
jgi:glycosyltransferase involved in cell wall biosynthesis